MKWGFLALAAALVLTGCSNTVQAVKEDTRDNISNVARAAERGTRNVANSLERTEQRLADD